MKYFRIFIVFSLSSYFDLIDENRSTLTHMISSILYDETFSFPIELICIELGYLIASIAFEVYPILLTKKSIWKQLDFLLKTFCLTRYGATPGKRALRLRVLKCEHLQAQDNGDLAIEPGTLLNSGAWEIRFESINIWKIFVTIYVLRALTRSSFKSLMSTFLFPAVIVALLTSQHRQTSYDMAANAVVVELENRQWNKDSVN